jgi:isocitrate dehydrogenase
VRSRHERRRKKVIELPAANEMGVKKIRFPETSGIGIKPVSQRGHRAPGAQRPSSTPSTTTASRVTLVHKGNIMKFTEGGFRDWGYALAQERVRRRARSTAARGASSRTRSRARASSSRTSIADAFLQQILLRPTEFDVIATLNLNGDYISDALAAQVGGIGIAPGANIDYALACAMFEATHGTAPKYAGKDIGQPGFGDPLGRDDAAPHGLDRGRRPRSSRAMEGAIGAKKVTYDFARLDWKARRQCQLLGLRRGDDRPTCSY